MSNFGIASFIPLILIILLAYFFLKRTNRPKRKKSRGKRNVWIYSAILAVSLVVYYVFITQMDTEEADVKLHSEYRETLYQFHGEQPAPLNEIDDFTLAGKWAYEMNPEHENLIVNTRNIVQVKKRNDNEPMIEVSYYRPSTFYVQGIEVAEAEVKNAGVTLVGKELALSIPHNQYAVSRTIISKEELINHYTNPNQMDDHSLHKLNNFFYQGFQLTVPEYLDVEMRGDGLLVEVE